jgi:lysozyme
MRMSINGIRLLAQWEGSRSHVYQDAVGNDTIGVGHLLTDQDLQTGQIIINGVPVNYYDGLTENQIFDLLAQDLEQFEQAVTNKVTVPLNQNQFDVLTSFAFNVGIGNFSRSTLLKVLNQGRYEQVPYELRRWTTADGQELPGLVKRRNNEIQLWYS